MKRVAILIGTLVGSSACEAYDPIPNAAPSLADLARAATRRMHERFTAALTIETAIVHGDLATAQRAARVFDVLDEPDAAAQWRPRLEEVVSAAHQIVIARGLEAAAEGTAQLGRACGRCHQLVSAQLSHAADPTLRPGPEITAAEMDAHQGAATEMWQGLIEPDDGQWQSGARHLAAIPPSALARAMTTSWPDDIDDVTRIQQDAKRGAAEANQDERAVLFGHILAACAHCHMTLRDR
jgi:hypothetical protein